MKNKQIRWYTRKNGETKGPFVESMIANNLLLGRLKLSDVVSQDQTNWVQLRYLPDFHPPQATQQTQKAKKLLDERNGFDRRNQQESVSSSNDNLRQGQERRGWEPEDTIERRQSHTRFMQLLRQQKQVSLWPISIAFIVLMLALLLAILFPKPLPTPQANCELAPAPEMNWNNCLKAKTDLHNLDLTGIKLRNSQLIGSNLMNSKLDNADLAYADLRFTNMSYAQLQSSKLLGANLQHADLSNSDLSEADLSFTDLRKANLGGTVLNNTRFDNAIWLDGRLCGRNSIDQCVFTEDE